MIHLLLLDNRKGDAGITLPERDALGGTIRLGLAALISQHERYREYAAAVDYHRIGIAPVRNGQADLHIGSCSRPYSSSSPTM